MKIRSSTKKGSVKRVIGRTAIILGIFLASILVLIYTAMLVICYGPSPRARDLFVNTCMETSFLKYFPPLVMSSAQIEEIREANGIVDNGEVTVGQQDYTNVDNQDKSQPDIEIVDVVGATYKGKMMIVKDPSRVVVGTSSDTFSADKGGKKLDQMIADEGAVGGVNAGGFVDDGGVGNGGMPIGLVIKNGKLLNGGLNTPFTVVGFDQKNMLHVGTMTGQQAMDKGLRDAVSFGPALVVNGNPMESSGTGGGLNPRTAIGQREDGSVLILVIDGRQPHSLGATHKDLVDVMIDFEAVNACNLDGGSSSMMYYEGELKTVCSSLYGPRRIPTAILVK
ncbi:phosphodiester glycosidase family protein [Phocea massiliensis]|uniref:Phosphodiester glycosidase family protein n=1 Tax=Merdimmobilis hominis TaxID=2897707 RepID=A0A938X719_9FIRM|nr:phosphodiester glycosidase family protein [Merdimmobilis hominis]MBM6920662.1 phosphodiester glycosidase family protein [Merdimmobilis hominis]